MSDAEPPGGTPPPEDRPPLEPLRQVDHGRVLVDRAVLEMVRTHVASDPTVEHGGILVGHVDSASGITIVIDAIRGVGTVTRSASLTFTHETWDHVNDVMAEKYPDAKMVGWYHSHPGFGIFLSDYDQFIHRNFFLERWQIAYVDDPVLDKWGFFGWDGDELVRFGRWGTWSSDDGDGPMVAVPPPAVATAAPPAEPPGAVPPPPPPAGPPPSAGPVLTVEADPEPRTGIRGWILGAGIFIAVALTAFLASSLLGGDDGPSDADEAASEVPSETNPAPEETDPPVTPTVPDPATTLPPDLPRPEILVVNATGNDDDNCAGTGARRLLERHLAWDSLVFTGDTDTEPGSTVVYAGSQFAPSAEQILRALGVRGAVTDDREVTYDGTTYDVVVIIGERDRPELDTAGSPC